MESSEEKHDGGDTSKRLKSLDLHGLHEEKSETSIGRARIRSAKLCVSRETRPTQKRNIAPERSKRLTCCRRDLSPSAFQSGIKRRRKGSGISSSFNHGLHSGIVKTNKSSSTCSNVQDQSTWGGDINIPRRPRGVLKRRSSLVNIKDATALFTSIVKSSSVAHSSKLYSDSITPTHPVWGLVGNQSKRHDECEETGPSGCDSVQRCKWDNGSSVQVVQKRARRNHRKRQDTVTGKLKHLVNGQLSFEDSAKFSDNCYEDDEESLEQNAARMLSSRFDPRFTGLSGDKSKVSSKSSSKSSSSASPSFDIAGRVLRPRKQNEKVRFKKRRHFYEVCSRGVDPYWVLKRRIRVFWPLDKSWYFGLVKAYDPKTKLHHVKYDDRDEEWINLQNERFKLLLLPSEFSHKFDSEKMEIKAKQENEAGIVSAMDDNCMSSLLESEPIISWLARSAHRVKTSSLKNLKEKRKSHFKNDLHSSLLKSQECVVGCPSSMTSIKPSILVTPDKSTDKRAAKVNPVKTNNCCDDRKFTFVYFRRRFHKKMGTVENELDDDFPWRLSHSAKLAAFVAVGYGACEESDVTLTALKQREEKLKFLLPLQWLPSLAWIHENSWLYKFLSLHYHGKLMIVWPIVCMEIVFLDSTMGSRLLSFRGYLQHAVVLMCLFVRIFHQPKRYTKSSELQLPFTSIGFRLSCLQGEGRQLLFYVYNFLDVESSQWLYLGRKLKQLAVTVKELPLSECTYASMKNLLCASKNGPLASYFWERIILESLRKMSCKGFIHRLDSKISASSQKSHPYSKLNGQNESCPFSQPFVTVPALFLFLHFKLLVEKYDASMNCKIPDATPLLDCPENSEKFTDECDSPVEDSSDQFSESTHENLGFTPEHVSSGWLSCPQSKFRTDPLTISNDCDLARSGNVSLSSELNLNGNLTVHRELGKQGNGETDSQFHRHPFSFKTWQDVGNPCSPLEDVSSAEESEGGCGSFLNTVNVQNQTSQSEDNVSDRGAKTAEKSTSYLTWSTNGFTTIHSPKPTAPRTIWHRNRQNYVPSSIVHHSKLLPEDWEGFMNSHKKPRTQTSYISSPFGGYDIGSKSQSHHRKERLYKKLKTDNAKKALVGPKSLESDLDSSTCNANVLVTAGDKGWREYGAQVLLESDDQKDWQILVKLSAATKYSYKVHQFWQPGTTNRFTHAMMWKGGKDWTLEFTDRSQWSLFKELYEECYNRNIRAASVKNIPIPGVCLIEDSDDFASEMPFVHSSPKYFRQIGTEVDMALDPSHVLYDMDSEDEDWISKLRKLADNSGRMLPELSEEMFEKAMDMFEKLAFEQHFDEFSDAEIDSFIAEGGPTEVMKAVSEHWLQKRQRKGMPLIRQFQPALWERYQQQVKEWESTVSKMHYSSNGCRDKAFSVEKPPMFAFCLRPRGLEVPNKGSSKQRSHKKFPVNGHHSTFARENYSLQGKKLNGYSLGKDKALVAAPSREFSDVTTCLQSRTGFSPRDPTSGFTTFAHGSSVRNHHLRLERSHSRKMGMSASPWDHLTVSPTHGQRTKGSGIYRSNPGFPERSPTTQYKSDGFHRHQADIDEFMLRDASSAAQHASNMAKLKREKAQWLMHKADLAIHRAVVAVMTADAMKTYENPTGDG
uniref:Enhancer of polycomb-like protein n=1 Tax=Anthurium amnicola TaxID=1678845 RepID=A0A1D1XET6_9ARAE